MFPSVCQGLELEQKDRIRHAWPCRLSLYLCLHNQLQGHASSMHSTISSSGLPTSLPCFPFLLCLYFHPQLDVQEEGFWPPIPGLSQTLFAQTNGTSTGLLVHLSELGPQANIGMGPYTFAHIYLDQPWGSFFVVMLAAAPWCWVHCFYIFHVHVIMGFFHLHYFFLIYQSLLSFHVVDH